MNTVPAQDASAREWLAFMTNDGALWLVYAVVVGIGLMAFLWCLGSIRTILARAEDGTGRLSSALIGAFPVAAEFLPALEADAQVGLAFHGAAGIVFPYAAMAAGVTVGAGAVVMLRTNTLPRWFAWTRLVAGVGVFFGGVVAVAFLLLPLWAIVIGVLITAGAGIPSRGGDEVSP